MVENGTPAFRNNFYETLKTPTACLNGFTPPTVSMQPSKDSLPLVLCNNGIHHLRFRRFLVKALEESTLYGRLPDLWSEAMDRIAGKLLREIAIQPGQRDGHGGGPHAVDPSPYRSIERPWPRFSPRHRPADRAMILRRPQRRVRPLA